MGTVKPKNICIEKQLILQEFLGQILLESDWFCINYCMTIEIREKNNKVNFFSISISQSYVDPIEQIEKSDIRPVA